MGLSDHQLDTGLVRFQDSMLCICACVSFAFSAILPDCTLNYSHIPGFHVMYLRLCILCF